MESNCKEEKYRKCYWNQIGFYSNMTLRDVAKAVSKYEPYNEYRKSNGRKDLKAIIEDLIDNGAEETSIGTYAPVIDC